MANTDYIQATIEIFGAIITVVVAMIFLIITKNEKKSEKNLFVILILSGFLLVMDAGWYIFDGNTTNVGIIANRICNLALFLTNPIMSILTNQYVCNVIKEKDVVPNKIISALAYISAIIAFAIPVLNQAYTFMYYFDDNNVYHRMTGWYSYTVFNCLAIIFCLLLIVIHRKTVYLKHRIALYVLFFAPFLGILLQSIIIGISFIQLGTALGCVIIISTYLLDWLKREKKESQISEDRKKIWIIECVFAIVILFISAAIISCAVSVINVSNKNSEQNSTSTAYMVSETVVGAFSEPINVSRTMAQSQEIIDALSADEIEGTETEEKMLSFMKRIKDKYDYQMIFVASERTKAYYTYEGLSRYMEVSKESKDSWYLDFTYGENEYELNIDKDKDNNNKLSVFINMIVKGENGEKLGVCGVGVSMDSLVEILSEYEEEYNLNILFINNNGLIEFCSNEKKIENEYYNLSNVDINSDEITYKRLGDKAILSKHYLDYGWNLIIEDNKPDKLNVFQIILPSMIIYVLGVILIMVFSFLLSAHEKHRSEKLKVSLEESEIAKAENFAKGRFLANMSHEIRTPINAVLGMDTMILRESNEPKIKEYAMIIKNAGNVLLSLINDILDISKIDSGKMEIIPKEYELSTLVLDAVNMVSIKADDKGLKLNIEVEKDLPSKLYGDDVRLRQVIVNILNNAVKYTEKGSVTLCIAGETIDDTVSLNIRVKDTGIGIKKEDIDKLFEDFTRIDESNNKNIEGTGLGMSITTSLLELMGSKLNVSSLYGHGSEFSFVIEQKIVDFSPVGNIELLTSDNSENYEYESTFTAGEAKILVVDDNDVNRVVFTSLLKETKIMIDEADCGKEALKKIYSEPYDIIFLDHMMPDMDGIEVLNKVKSNIGHPNISTPVIVLTANAISGAKEQYIQAGFNDYLSKPIIPEQLEKMIVKLLPAEKIVEGEKKKVEVEKSKLDLPMEEGIDWNYARLHLSDDDSLINTLRSFEKSVDSEAKKLESIYKDLLNNKENKDILDLYRVTVHAMKSTSTLLGFVPIAGVAATLEMAARRENVDEIIKVTPYFLSEWRGYKEKLAFVKENDFEKKDIGDFTLIRDYLNQLKEAALNFDVHGADSVIDKLSKFDFSDDDELMGQIEVAVNNLDMEEVEKLCDELIVLIGER